MLFHTGPRRLFPLVRDAISRVTRVEDLRYPALSDLEADECGSLNDFLAVAGDAEPVCSRIAAMVSISDFADKPPRNSTWGSTPYDGWIRRTYRTAGTAA